MTYFKINGYDFSHFVNELKVKRGANYNAQTNAAGDTVVDYINHKRTVEVGFVPLDRLEMYELKLQLRNLNVSISFYDVESTATDKLTTISCIAPDVDVEYYTIQSDDKVLHQPFTVKFTEL